VERRVMTDATEPTKHPASRCSHTRRIAITVVLSAIFSLALWFMALSATTSLLAGTGAGVVILMATSISRAFETILETIGAFVLGLLVAIGDILGAVFGSLLE
jgi:hypothetical protein